MPRIMRTIPWINHVTKSLRFPSFAPMALRYATVILVVALLTLSGFYGINHIKIVPCHTAQEDGHVSNNEPG